MKTPMTNYEKAKKEGIEELIKIAKNLTWITEDSFAAVLSSLAEKIKEAVERDNKYTLAWDIGEKPNEWCVILWKEDEYDGKTMLLELHKNSENKTGIFNLSDSQTIKE